MPLHNQLAVSFLATALPDQSKAFYEDIAGLELVEETGFALVFALASPGGSSHLRIQKVASVSPLPYTAMGWQVEDISKTVTALTARGAVFEYHDGMVQDALGVWTSPAGARVAWFRDPDGNLLSLTQLD